MGGMEMKRENGGEMMKERGVDGWLCASPPFPPSSQGQWDSFPLCLRMIRSPSGICKPQRPPVLTFSNRLSPHSAWHSLICLQTVVAWRPINFSFGDYYGDLWWSLCWWLLLWVYDDYSSTWIGCWNRVLTSRFLFIECAQQLMMYSSPECKYEPRGGRVHPTCLRCD